MAIWKELSEHGGNGPIYVFDSFFLSVFEFFSILFKKNLYLCNEHLFFFFSIMVYLRILNIVPCAI